MYPYYHSGIFLRYIYAFVNSVSKVSDHLCNAIKKKGFNETGSLWKGILTSYKLMFEVLQEMSFATKKDKLFVVVIYNFQKFIFELPQRMSLGIIHIYRARKLN